MTLAQQLIVDATDPYLTEAELRQLAISAQDAEVYAICVLPGRVRQATIMVARSRVLVRTLVGYPGGVHTASVKGLETRLALQEGAFELAVAPNLGYFLGDEEQNLKNEIAYVAKAVREVAPHKARSLSVVFDMERLQPQMIDRFAQLVLGAGGHGIHLDCKRIIEPDDLRSLLRALASRSTTDPVTLQTIVADAATAQALLDVGADYVMTPNAAEVIKP